jgi:hypothetical protein
LPDDDAIIFFFSLFHDDVPAVLHPRILQAGYG